MNTLSDSTDCGAIKSTSLFQGLRPYGLGAYSRALSRLFCLGASPLRPSGLPPGFVAARFPRCALKTWADGLRPFYPPTAARRPSRSGICLTYGLAAERRTPNDEIPVQTLQFWRFNRLTHESGSHDARIESRSVR